MPKMRRRTLLQTAAVAAGGVAIEGFSALFGAAQASDLQRETPNVTLGPFYPLTKPDDQDFDLTGVPGRTSRAAGVVLELSGLVRNRHGQPVPHATIEIWQANTYGRYVHPSDFNSAAALDPNFQGYAVVRTDSEGRYRIRTIKPGPYPAFDGDWMRAPHIHLDVRGRLDRKITQMYFPGEPLNAQDRVFQAVRRHEELLASVSGSSEGTTIKTGDVVATWNITLASG